MLVNLRDGSAYRPSNMPVNLRDGSAYRPSNMLVYLRDGSAYRPSNMLVYLRDGSAYRPSNMLVYLRDGSAYRPSNMLVYLRDGSAQTTARAATLKTEVADQIFYLTRSYDTDTGPTSPSPDLITPGILQGSHRSARCCVTGLTPNGKRSTAKAGNRSQVCRSGGGHLNHWANEAVRGGGKMCSLQDKTRAKVADPSPPQVEQVLS